MLKFVERSSTRHHFLQEQNFDFRHILSACDKTGRRKKKKPQNGLSGNKRISRLQASSKEVEDITMGSDRYNLWWIGPPDNEVFKIGIFYSILFL